MAGMRLGNGFIDFADGFGSAKVNGRTYRWEFHEYCGPNFLRKDGEPISRYPSEKHPIWPAVERWIKRYYKAKAKAEKEALTLKT